MNRIVERYVVYRDHFDVMAEIGDEGEARLVLKSADEEAPPIVLDPDDFAAVLEIWKRATRADD